MNVYIKADWMLGVVTAKKLSPGKVEDQENASVARPTHKRSADALLTPTASAKTDPEITLVKVRQNPCLMANVSAKMDSRLFWSEFAAFPVGISRVSPLSLLPRPSTGAVAAVRTASSTGALQPGGTQPTEGQESRAAATLRVRPADPARWDGGGGRVEDRWEGCGKGREREVVFLFVFLFVSF